MSKLIENIKRLAGIVKNETKSGGNTAARIGGLFEEIAAELEEKYDKSESDKQASEHNTDAGAHKNIQERIDTVLNDLNREKLDKTGDGKDVVVSFNEAAERVNVSSEDTLSVLLGKVQKWFAGLQVVAFSGRTADLVDDAEHRLTTDTEKVRWNDTYTQQETDNKDSSILQSLKEYADNQISGLGNDVYWKGETYTRSETDAKDTATLNTAKQYVLDRIAEIIGGSPAALDTLYEIAKALGNDPHFATSIMALINGKAPLVHTHTKIQITDFPSSMPASDVYAWAKQPNKPAYTFSEVGAAAVDHKHTRSQITDFPDLSVYATQEWVQNKSNSELSIGEFWDMVELGITNQFGQSNYVSLRGADSEKAGLMTIEDQSFAGNKTFIQDVIARNFYKNSDRRLKRNIHPCKVVDQEVRWVDFELKGESSCGVIAQEVEKIYPQAVSTGKEGFKRVNYDYVFVKELARYQKKMRELEQEIVVLKNR